MLANLMKHHLKVDIDKMRMKGFLKYHKDQAEKLIEKAKKKHGLKEVSLCPLCGSAQATQELNICGSPLLRCNECELRFLGKIPADPRDIYDSEYVVYPLDDYQYRVERFGKERVRLLETHCGDLAGKKILDVGCGNGYFLSALKTKGAKCVGAELNEKWAKFTADKTGFPVYTEALVNFPEKDFDIITLFDVIEHIERPIPFMNSICKLLGPKGHILIYTPNYDSFSVKVMGEHSNVLDASEHVILWSHNSLQSLANVVGLKIKHVETRGLDIHSILALQDYLGEKRDPFLIKWLEELQAMIDASGCGDYIRVIFEKDDSR